MKTIRIPLEPELGSFIPDPQNPFPAYLRPLVVELEVQDGSEVATMVCYAMQAEQVLNYKPRIILLGGEAYYALLNWFHEHDRFPAIKAEGDERSFQGVPDRFPAIKTEGDERSFQGVPFLLDDEMPANAVRVLSSPRDQEAKFLRSRVR